jgi:hypothetical protein
LQRSDIKWLDFLSGLNTIVINNEKEFNKFRDFLMDIGLEVLLRNETEYADWQRISLINNYSPDCIIFEFQPAKGMTIGYTVESSKEWYGEDPMTVDVLDAFYENSRCAKEDKFVELDLEEDIDK